MVNVNVDDIVELLKQEHPFWTDDAIAEEAQAFVDEVDERFNQPLTSYQKGECIDVTVGEYSLSKICLLRGCSYILTFAVDLRKNAI